MKNIFFLACIIFTLFLSIGTKQCEAQTNSLKYLGNAFVKIKTFEGKIVYIDPYAVSDLDSADIVLITHEHSDHNDLTRVTQKTGCQVIRAANAIKDSVYQNFVIGNIKIKAVAAYDKKWHPKFTGVGYVVEFDGIKVYHAGGTKKVPEMADLANQNITYALLPMTSGPENMTEAAAMIQAKHDIPIHSKVSLDLSIDTARIGRFASPHKLIVLPNQTIELTHDTTSSAVRILCPAEEKLTNKQY